MKDCIFCKIVSGIISAEKVYEDGKILVFLDNKPVNPGHVLVIPKKHYPSMIDVPDELVSYIFIKSKEFSKKIKNSMKADFVVLSIVGIDVPHFHIHLIPRYFNDGLANFWPHKEYGKGEMKKVGEKLRGGSLDNNSTFLLKCLWGDFNSRPQPDSN